MTNEMESLKLLFCIKIYFLVLLFEFTLAVPPDYCFHQLNKSDCNAKPTPVFTYFHPGSRCEIEIWRGCPTLNKFDDQYQCSQQCIYKYRTDFIDNKIVIEEMRINNTKMDLTDDVSETDWQDEIKRLPEKDAHEVIDILDNVLNNTTTKYNKALKRKITRAPKTTTEIITTLEEISTTTDHASTLPKSDTTVGITEVTSSLYEEEKVTEGLTTVPTEKQIASDVTTEVTTSTLVDIEPTVSEMEITKTEASTDIMIEATTPTTEAITEAPTEATTPATELVTEATTITTEATTMKIDTTTVHEESGSAEEVVVDR